MLTATDKGTVRIVVVILGVLALACVGGVIALAATQTPIPSTLEVTTGLTVGAFVGLLTKTSSGAGAAEAVAALGAAQAAGLSTPDVQPRVVPPGDELAAGKSMGAAVPIVIPLDSVADAPAAAAAVVALDKAGPTDSAAFGAGYAVVDDQPSADALAAQTAGVPPVA